MIPPSRTRRALAFLAFLALAFGGAALAGAAAGPTDEPAAPAGATHADGGHGDDAPAADGAGAALAGLAVSEDGYTLEVDRDRFTAGRPAPFTFRITDARGRVVRDEFEVEHDKELHLVVVRRDTAVFDHVHPRRDQDGTWSIDLRLRQPGVYRAYADFKVDGEKRTLATDLFVPGDFRPNPLPAPALADRTVDTAGRPAGDLDIDLAAPGVRAGRETALRFAVGRDGRPFEALEPYLAAKGHLVALREGDLGYLHVHPTDAGPASEVAFAATFPTAGRYRLFLQVKAGGEVRTVAYTLEVPR